MDLPFDVQINYKDNNTIEHVKLHPYLDSQKNFVNYNHLNTFKEDYPLSLSFVSDDDSYHLFSSDLGRYDIPGKQEDDHGNVYFSATQKPYPLYPLYDRTKFPRRVQEDALSSNIYTLIVTNGLEYYYFYFVIRPKELSKLEWQDMINDLNVASKNLALQYHNQTRGITQVVNNKITQFFAHRLANMSKDIINALHFILQDIHYSSNEKYRWVKLGKEKRIDFITIKEMNKHSPMDGNIYAPYRYIDYNINDNKWIKYFINRLIYWTVHSIRLYSEIINHDRDNKSYESINDIKKEQDILYHLRYYLDYVSNNTVFNKVSSIPPKFITKDLVISPRYNNLFNLYRKVRLMRGRKFTVKFNQYSYKDTNKLYEFWTFLKTFNILISDEFGYKKIKETIPSMTESTKYLWPLIPNTRIILKRDNSDVWLRLVYDDPIDNKKNYFTEPISVFTSHNRPDIRIDIFKGSRTFLGSIILDAKYKKLNTIVNNKVKNSVREQLQSYTNATTADDVENQYIRFHWFGEPVVVPLVFALYPTPTAKTHQVLRNMSQFKQNEIIVEPLRPGPHQIFTNKFCMNLKNILNKYDNSLI